MAHALGDPTAKIAGRISLNPARHLDPAGTIFLLFAGFGWGRPVPVNPANFRNFAVGEFLTSVAGPASNVALALALAIPYNFLATPDTFVWLLLQTGMYLNLLLAVFNILPIAPLDGGNMLAAFLPWPLREKFLQYGPIILFSVIAADFAFGTRILWGFLGPAVDILWAAINIATRFGG